METNNIDKKFKDTFKNRTLTPSNSAWERLQKELDQQQNIKRKKTFTYVAYAATLLIFLTTGIYMTSNQPEENNNETEIITKNPILTAPVFPSEKIIETPFPENKTEDISITSTETNEKKETKITIDKPQLKVPMTTERANISEIHTDTSNIEIATTITYQIKKNKIHIDAEALLKSVLEPEVITLDKKEKLALIKKELNKLNITLDPNEILAEVEKEIYDTSFEENFLKALKSNITTLTAAISKRNK